MRHRKRGRHLGRTSSHRVALLRNLASALFLTERDAEFDPNPPKIKGRIITTLQKAKEVRPLVERCITIARKVLDQKAEAERLYTSADRGSEAWRSWRESDDWQEWNKSAAPVVAARRRHPRNIGLDSRPFQRYLFSVDRYIRLTTEQARDLRSGLQQCRERAVDLRPPLPAWRAHRREGTHTQPT